MINLPDDWQNALCGEFDKPYYRELRRFLKAEYSTKTIYPPAGDIYNAFRLTPLNHVKVVILGQDPYINRGEAHGLAFSVNQGVKIPPSLQNIYQAVHNDIGCDMPVTNGCLIPWAKQGVFLLNTVLTVRAGASNSHQNHGWEEFTDTVISILNDHKSPKVFLLWGAKARKKGEFIDGGYHSVIQGIHPSPLTGNSSTFINYKHFSKANEFLLKHTIEPINWQIM